MDFPFLEWSVLEQTRFDIFVFFSNLFAEKCFWISFFHSNSLCEGLFLHVLALYDVLCKKIHISLKLRSLFWGHLLSIIGQNFFCDYCVKLWHYFDLIHLQCNTDIKCTYIFGQVKKWVNDDPDIESFFLSLSCCIYAKMQFELIPIFIQEDLPIVWAESSVNWFHKN